MNTFVSAKYSFHSATADICPYMQCRHISSTTSQLTRCCSRWSSSSLNLPARRFSYAQMSTPNHRCGMTSATSAARDALEGLNWNGSSQPGASMCATPATSHPLSSNTQGPQI
uniref:Uncharacterized protein n=1 Tax=Cacopsylla melanoneura TaxID=428564 RepID=A0A8D8SBZ0_9HEMI